MHDAVVRNRPDSAAANAHFGEHVTVDGYNGNPDLLNSKDVLVSSIEELCTILGMQKLSDISALSAPDNHIKDPGGWSGFVIVAESHISIHTFPKRRFVSADVYTCRNGIDADAIGNYFRQKYELDDVEVHFIIRGTRYPAQNVA